MQKAYVNAIKWTISNVFSPETGQRNLEKVSFFSLPGLFALLLFSVTALPLLILETLIVSSALRFWKFALGAYLLFYSQQDQDAQNDHDAMEKEAQSQKISVRLFPSALLTKGPQVEGAEVGSFTKALRTLLSLPGIAVGTVAGIVIIVTLGIKNFLLGSLKDLKNAFLWSTHGILNTLLSLRMATAFSNKFFSILKAPPFNIASVFGALFGLIVNIGLMLPLTLLEGLLFGKHHHFSDARAEGEAIGRTWLEQYGTLLLCSTGLMGGIFYATGMSMAYFLTVPGLLLPIGLLLLIITPALKPKQSPTIIRGALLVSVALIGTGVGLSLLSVFPLIPTLGLTAAAILISLVAYNGLYTLTNIFKPVESALMCIQTGFSNLLESCVLKEKEELYDEPVNSSPNFSISPSHPVALNPSSCGP